MIDKNHPFYETFEKEINSISEEKIIVDIGTSQRFAKEMKPFENLFTNNYFALGYNAKKKYGKYNCNVSGDILNLPFINNSIDAIICLEVLEHVKNPFIAIEEVYRVLKPKGKLILSIPFLSPYHGKTKSIDKFSHSYCPDFWRFSNQGLELLLEKFSKKNIIPVSNTISFYLYDVFKLDKFPILNLKSVRKLIDKIIPKKYGNPTYRYFVFANK